MPVSMVSRYALQALFAVTALIVAAVVAPLMLAAAAPAPVPPMAPRSAALLDATRVEIAAGSSEARYVAHETLSGQGFNEAIGRTSGVQGAIVLDAAGAVVPDQSKVIVNMASLTSDSSTRDNYINRNTLQVDQFPTAEITVTSAPGLPTPLPTSGTATFQLVGDLTVHGVTRPTTWNATATFTEGGVTAAATTTVLMTEFGMEPPRVGRVLSIEDSVQLELDVKGTVAPSIADLLSAPS
jgi:polyisoprenoid-binding protein YceI